jgi:hypothetical protein
MRIMVGNASESKVDQEEFLTTEKMEDFHRGYTEEICHNVKPVITSASSAAKKHYFR